MLHTGDLAIDDDDGVLEFRGRRPDRIRRRGELVGAMEVELDDSLIRMRTSSGSMQSLHRSARTTSSWTLWPGPT